MAKKKYRPPISEYTHKECVHAYGHYDIGAEGEPILCRCKYKKYILLLSDPVCLTNFKKIQ